MKDFPRNGPSGWYSNAWMSRADQSLTSSNPNTCDRSRRSRSARHGDSPCRPRNRVPTRCPAACSGATRPPRPSSRAQRAGRRLCPTRRPCPRARGSRRARGASSGATVHLPAGTTGPGSSRGGSPRRIDVVAHGNGQLQLQLVAPHDEVRVDRCARHAPDHLAHVPPHIAARSARKSLRVDCANTSMPAAPDVSARRGRANRSSASSPNATKARGPVARVRPTPNGRFASVKSESAGMPLRSSRLGRRPRCAQRFPRRACSASIDSNSALKLPSPNPRAPLALDDLDEHRRPARDVLGEDLQQVAVVVAVDEDAELGQLRPRQVDVEPGQARGRVVVVRPRARAGTGCRGRAVAVTVATMSSVRSASAARRGSRSSRGTPRSGSCDGLGRLVDRLHDAVAVPHDGRAQRRELGRDRVLVEVLQLAEARAPASYQSTHSASRPSSTLATTWSKRGEPDRRSRARRGTDAGS